MKKIIAFSMILSLIFLSGCSKNKITSDNPYFFVNEGEKLYSGEFMYPDLSCKNVKLNITELSQLDQGKLYSLKLEPVNVEFYNETIDIPEERLLIGYFYVKSDKIYRLIDEKIDLESFTDDEEIIDKSEIVCQNENLNDTLAEDEKGWHQYIEIKDDIVEYHSYNNNTETGWYQTFYWKKNKGLIYYRSGFGAGKKGIELKILE